MVETVLEYPETPFDRALDRFPLHDEGFLAQGQVGAALAIIDRLFASVTMARREADVSFRPFALTNVNDAGLQKAYRGIVGELIVTFLQAPGFTRLRRIVGDDFYFLMRHCLVRRRNIEHSFDRNRWHFDADFMGADGEMLNAWIPLVDVGENLPGLSFLQGREERMASWRIWQDWARENWSASVRNGPAGLYDDDDALARLLGWGEGELELRTPSLTAGDALIFNQFVLHRTQELAHSVGVRTSFEVRLAAVDALPSVYVDQGLAVARCRLDGGSFSLRFGAAGKL